MTVKRKDFQKTAAYLQEFILKLNEDGECAELRDALNLALLHMQKYYRTLQSRLQDNKNNCNGLSRASSVRGLSPMTPFRDAPDKFEWKWFEFDNPRLSIVADNGKRGSLANLPLILQAAKAGDVNLVREIIAKERSRLHDTDALGRTALMYAVNHRQYDLVKLIIGAGADVNQTAHDGTTALHRACHDALDMAVRIMLQSGCQCQPQDVYGRAPIHWSVITESTQCLKLLMEYGANVNIRDKDGLSPSMWACRMDNIQHFQLLSQVENQDIQEADGIERDNSGRTWMHWAVRRTEPLECLRTLLTEETAPIKDDDGKTVLLLAAELGSLPACRLIVEIAGEDCLLDRDDQDRSALHLSVHGGHGEVVNFLLEKGSDLDLHDKHNASPLDYARSRQLHYCQLILSSHIRQRAREGRTSESLASISRETSGFFDAYSKPITPPHPPRLPPPTTPRKIKRPLRSNSFTRSETFDGKESYLLHARSKSLDVQEYHNLRNTSAMFPETPQPEAGDATEGELTKTARAPDLERPRTSRGSMTRQRTPRSPPDAPNRKEARRDDVVEIMTFDVDKKYDDERLSIGEMEVSDLDGEADDSDQNTVIHRPVARQPPSIKQPPLQPPKFQPHPPPAAQPYQPQPPYQYQPPSLGAAPPQPRYQSSISTVYKPKEVHQPALMRRSEQDHDPRHVTTTRKPAPVAAPRAPLYQGRIPPPQQRASPGASTTNLQQSLTSSQSSLAAASQTQTRPTGSSLFTSSQRSPQSRAFKSSDKSPSQDHLRSSSQASSQDLTSHEMHEEVVVDQKHPATAPLTPPDSKRRPPLPPQLMPLNQPRLAGSHMPLPPAKKERRKKKKRENRENQSEVPVPPARGYAAPLLPSDAIMQPNVKSANIYARRSGDSLRGTVEQAEYGLGVRAALQGVDETAIFTMEDSERLHDNSLNHGRIPGPPSRRLHSPSSSAQKGRWPANGQSYTDPLAPPQVEGHRMEYRRTNAYAPHLPPTQMGPSESME